MKGLGDEALDDNAVGGGLKVDQRVKRPVFQSSWVKEDH